ncbi:TetR/AcrR family transcriptional regulator [Actinosynnema sp. NPDC059797]
MTRPLRADARRNRDRLLATALEAFSTEGADVPLELVAKRAGVGIGTLYRHFPTREALVEAVYRNELGKLCDAVPELLDTLPPDLATRAWMDRFLDYTATKHGMADALRAVVASGADPYSESRELLVGAMTRLLAAMGRTDLEPTDVLVTVAGIAGAAAQLGDPGRMLDLVLDGLRHRS